MRNPNYIRRNPHNEAIPWGGITITVTPNRVGISVVVGKTITPLANDNSATDPAKFDEVYS